MRDEVVIANAGSDVDDVIDVDDFIGVPRISLKFSGVFPFLLASTRLRKSESRFAIGELLLPVVCNSSIMVTSLEDACGGEFRFTKTIAEFCEILEGKGLLFTGFDASWSIAWF